VRDPRRLRDEVDYLRAVTDSMGEGLLVDDEGGRLTYVNAAAEALPGWMLAEIEAGGTHDAIDAIRPHFGRKTVAEGVEDAETLEQLGVDYGQGSGTGRPAPVAQVPGRGTAPTAA
jgi:PAS domain-containing protein